MTYGGFGSGRYSTKASDYVSGLAYLGKKVDRPFGYATRIRLIERSRSDGRLAGECKGVGIYHHGTLVVVWRGDGLTEFLAYDSVTTKQRINGYAPVRLWSERGELYVGRYDDETLPRTAAKVMRCRACRGSKLRTTRVYRDPRTGRESDYRHGWGSRQTVARYVTRHERFCNDCAIRCDAETCNAGWTNAEWHGTSYGGKRAESLTPQHHRHGTGEFESFPCDDCNGTGERDYGSRPIYFRVLQGQWYICANDGRVIGHGYNSWLAVQPPKPLKTKRIVGELSAWRGWGLTSEGTLTPLGVNGAPNYDSFNLPAPICRAGRSHSVPDSECSCGYWAVHDPDDVPCYSNRHAQVFGNVNLWGEIIEHRLGYRCESLSVNYLIIEPCKNRHPSEPLCAGDCLQCELTRSIARKYSETPVYSALFPLTMPVDELLPVTVGRSV